MRAPFTSIHDLTRRVPELRKDELTTLAEIGALNSIGSQITDRRLQMAKPNQSEIYNQNLNLLPTRNSQLETRNSPSIAATRSGRSNAPSAPPAHCSNNKPSRTPHLRSRP